VLGHGSPGDHYRTLGVARDASTHEIRRAYRRLARRHHPDVNPADGAERFVAITGAYHTLSDPAARAHYDRTLTTTPSPSSCSQPDGPEAGGRARVGTLELSLEEAAHLIHHPLTLTDGTTTIRLPAGLGDGDTIALRSRGYLIVLQIHVTS
jgi:hypothetical protein